MKIVVLPYQSFFDIAIQYLGSVLTAFDVAKANKMSVTDKLSPGIELIIPESDFQRKDIADFFAGRKIIIANSKINTTTEDLSGYGFPEEFPIGF